MRAQDRELLLHGPRHAPGSFIPALHHDSARRSPGTNRLGADLVILPCFQLLSSLSCLAGAPIQVLVVELESGGYRY